MWMSKETSIVSVLLYVIGIEICVTLSTTQMQNENNSLMNHFALWCLVKHQ